jgi:hypothetical protein
MSRIYAFSCEKCGYQAKVAGGLAAGFEVTAVTVQCNDCHALYDAVTAVRSQPPDAGVRVPLLQEITRRLLSYERSLLEWHYFEPACPVSSDHRVKEWRHPGRCPVCAVFMEPSGIPFREWE